MKNDAEIDKDDKKQDGTTGSGKVVRQGWEAVKGKAKSDLQDGAADNQKIARWNATAKSPESASSITLCDRFFDPVNKWHSCFQSGRYLYPGIDYVPSPKLRN